MNITIIGLGLIGGSTAIDLRRTGISTCIVGVDSNVDHADQALQMGLVDEVQTMDDALKNSDLVFLTIPVHSIVALLPLVLDKVPDHAVVIDFGSTKEAICNSVKNHFRRNLFVAAHPIAGTENSGPAAALPRLYENKNIIICEKEKSSSHALDTAEKIFKTLLAKPIYMSPLEHDKCLAYVSHLSHISSFLLGHTVMDIEKSEKNIFDIAGSGFASTVRLAKSSPNMWVPIFEQNRDHLSLALLQYIQHLQQFYDYLVAGDRDAMHAILASASNRIRNVFDKEKIKKEIKKIETPST